MIFNDISHLQNWLYQPHSPLKIRKDPLRAKPLNIDKKCNAMIFISTVNISVTLSMGRITSKQNSLESFFLSLIDCHDHFYLISNLIKLSFKVEQLH